MSIIFEDGIIKTPEIEFDENCGGIGNIFFSACKIYTDRIAVINTRTDEYHTYTDLLEHSIATALALERRGIKEQDLIALCSNRENLIANLPIIAGQFLGCITFSLDPGLSIEECSELVEQVQPRIIFVIEGAQHLIRKTLEKCDVHAEIIVFGQQFNDEFLQLEDVQDSFMPKFIKNLRKTCMIHFSSGSTGTPKPICLSHYSLLASLSFKGFKLATTLAQKERFDNHLLSSVSLRYANWYWCSTSFELMVCIAKGGCILLRDEFEVDKIFHLMQKYHITDMQLTPSHCVKLSRCEKPKMFNISSLKTIVTGGFVLHNDYIYDLRQLLPGVNISQIYGMTECGGVTTFDFSNPEHQSLLLERPNSCGLPANGLIYKVIDVNTGEKCGPKQPGELYIKGKKLFNGFYKKDASGSFDTEGFFKTGDLVSFDEDYCFYVLDRIKAILVWKDFLIYPFHIEKVLLHHPAVENAVVIGIPHKVESERLMGVVQLTPRGPKLTEEELVKYVDERVEDHKRLREGVKFVEQFPTTITGKINRLKVKELVLNNLIMKDI